MPRSSGSRGKRLLLVGELGIHLIDWSRGSLLDRKLPDRTACGLHIQDAWRVTYDLPERVSPLCQTCAAAPFRGEQVRQEEGFFWILVTVLGDPHPAAKEDPRGSL